MTGRTVLATGGGGAAWRARGDVVRVVVACLCAAVLVTGAATALPGASGGGSTSSSAGAGRELGRPAPAIGDPAGAGSSVDSWGELPAPAQSAVSGALGRDQAMYHASPTAGGFELTSRGGGVSARFDGAGAQLAAGGANVRLSLASVGYGAALQPVPAVEPRADANRVEYARPGLSEWFVNGPAGLEHGFTLTQPPAGVRDGDLTLGLSLRGGTAQVDGDGLGATLNGGSGSLRYAGLWAADADGRTVPARLSAAGDEVRVAVDDRNAAYPITIDPYIDTAILTSSTPSAHSPLGVSVAISGDTIVVGQSPDIDNQGFLGYPEAAYVFVRPAGGWADATQTAKLTAVSGLNESREFGTSVAIAGDTIVVGADWDTIGGNEGQGSAYVFVRPAGGWVDMTPTAKLTAADGTAYAYFGISVAIEGGTIVVGAPWAGTAGPEETPLGQVYVFERPAGGWANATQTATLVGRAFEFGSSVAIAGDTIVVGATEPNLGQGSAYVFVRPAGGWSHLTPATAKLTAADGQIDDYFGFSVAIAGDTIVVGSLARGSAYVFVRPAGGWGDATQTAKLTASGGGSGVGRSVAIAGNTIVATGYVFARPVSGWANATQTSVLTSTAPGALGWSVAISADTIVGGAPDGNFRPGSAVVFEPDEIAPQTTIVSGPSGTTNDSTPTFGFSSNEARSTFECRVDGAQFVPCLAPLNTATLLDGPHTFEVRGTDRAGNTDQTPAFRSFTVDTTAPQTTIDTSPSGTTNVNTPTFSFSSTEGGSSFECRVDGAQFAPCLAPLTAATLLDGPHTFEVRAADAVGNTDQTPATRSFVVDTVAPQTTIDSGPSGTTNLSTPTFGFSSSETGSSFACRVDSAQFAPCSSPLTTVALSDGPHSFEVRATDVAGNIDQTPAFRSFTVVTVPVDTSPPSLACSAAPSTLKGTALKSNNHKLLQINTTVTVTDEIGGSGAAGFMLVSVTSSQGDSGLARDDVAGDIQGWTLNTADTSGLVRQERYNTDRVYTLTYQGRDNAGNTATCQSTVTVKK